MAFVNLLVSHTLWLYYSQKQALDRLTVYGMSLNAALQSIKTQKMLDLSTLA